MASPVTTSGFSVQVMPRVDYADPRTLVPRYDSIIPGISQGLGAVGQLAQIYENAQQAPIRRQLAQIQLEEARAQAGLAPLIADRKRIELQQPIERVISTGIEEVPRYMPQVMLDEAGQQVLDAQGQPRMEVPAGMDIFSTEQYETIDPVTGRRAVATRRIKPLQTMEQAGVAEERQDIARLTAESLAAARAQKAMLDQERLDNPNWKKVGYGVDENGFVVYTVQNAKSGETQQIATKLTPAQSGLTAAITQLIGKQPANIAQPTGGGIGFRIPDTAAGAVALDDDTQSVIDGAVRAFGDKPEVTVFTTADAVKAAYKAGAITRAEAENILRKQFGKK